MKIDAYGASATEFSRSLNTSGADTTKSSTTGANIQQVSTEDTTSFASGSASVQDLTNAAFDTTSRAAKIASLQHAVRSGQYAIDPANIAAALSKADF